MTTVEGLFPQIKPIDGGYRVKETSTHYLDVMRQLYNWRLVTTSKSL